MLLPVRTLLALQFRGSTDRVSFMAGVWYSAAQSLDTLPNGATTFKFWGTFGSGTLTGATIVNGHVEAPGPFAITFSGGSPRGTSGDLQGFGADFMTAGPDVLTLSFYRGLTLLASVSRETSGTGLQFLGGVFHSGTMGDRVEISTRNAYPVVADNLILAAPEPSTWALLGTGLLTLAGLAVRRRKHAGDHLEP
jgi:hypothetical protein